MAVTTITQFPLLPLSGANVRDGAYDFVLPLDATIEGNLRTYKVTMGQIRNFVLNSSRAHAVSGSDNMLLANEGNVGIGTSNPTHKLHVTGQIKASGTITSTDGFIGNVESATKLFTTRLISIDGDISANTIAFDGTGNNLFTTSITPAAVTTAKIKDGAVTATKLDEGSVVAGKIAARQVRAEHINLDHVRSEHILAGAVNSSEIRAGAVTSTKLAAGSVTNAKIASNQIDSGHLKNNIITNAKIVSGAVNAAKIADGSITPAKIGTGAVTSEKILVNAVTDGKIAAGAVTTDKIQSSSVTHIKLQGVPNVQGTYNKNPYITVNDKGIITAMVERAPVIMETGGTMTGRLTLAGDPDISGQPGGLEFKSNTNTSDSGSITFDNVGDRHTLRLKVHGSEASQDIGVDDRIVLEVPNLSGVSVKVGDNEYPVWHTGHVPNIVEAIQNYYNTHAFTHFQSGVSPQTPGAVRSAESGNTLVLTSDDVKQALGFTPMPNTRAQITGNLGFEPLSRTRSKEFMTGHLAIGSVHGSWSSGQVLAVNGPVRFKGMLALDRLGTGWGGEILLKPHETNSFIYVGSGSKRITIGDGSATIRGDGYTRLFSTNDYVHLKSFTSDIYYDGRDHRFRYKDGKDLAVLYKWRGKGALSIGANDRNHGRLFINSEEHQGLVIRRTGSSQEAMVGVTENDVTFGGYGWNRALIRIEKHAAGGNGDWVMKFREGNNIQIKTKGGVSFYARQNTNSFLQLISYDHGNDALSAASRIVCRTKAGHHWHALTFYNGGGVGIGPKSQESLLYLQNYSNNGLVGIGTRNPTHNAQLTVQERPSTHASIFCRNAGNNGGIWLGHNWEHRAGSDSAIHNDTTGYKTMMVIGNTKGGWVRKVSVWDALTIGGNSVLWYGSSKLSVHGDARISGWLKTGGINTTRVEETEPTDFAVRAYWATYGHQSAADGGYYNKQNRGVYVNGNHVSSLRNRGINTVILSPHGGRMTHHGSHDVYGNRNQWDVHIAWIRQYARRGDVVVCTIQDAQRMMQLPIRSYRNTRSHRERHTGSWHRSNPTQQATAFYTRMGARKLFEMKDGRYGAAWAFIMPDDHSDAYKAGAEDGYEEAKNKHNRTQDGFHFCFIEKCDLSNHQGSESIAFTYNSLMAAGGASSYNQWTRAKTAPQKMAMSVTTLRAESIVKTDPDMNDFCYPPSGDALIYNNPYIGYGSDGHGGNDRGYKYPGYTSEPLYWRDHTHSFDDWSYSYGRRRRHTWYERQMIRIGWGNQYNHYGGLRIRIPDGVDTLWVQNHAGWQHHQVYYLHKNGTTNPGYNNGNSWAEKNRAPGHSGRHPRYGYKKRSGVFGASNADHHNVYTPQDGTTRGVRHWIGDSWHPIPLERKLLDDHPYITLCQRNSSSAWVTGLAFGRNPWNHAKVEAVNMHWRLNGGDYMWWSGHWWYRNWCYAHAWHNRYIMVPCIFNGKDKILYMHGHAWGADGQAGQGWGVQVNGVNCGSFHSGFQNPFKNRTDSHYLGAAYKGIHIPKEVVMKSHYDGNGSVASGAYKGDVGYIRVRMCGGWADYSSYMSEMGTHDYYPDPYIVHSGLQHNNIDGPLNSTEARGHAGYPNHYYEPGGTYHPGW